MKKIINCSPLGLSIWAFRFSSLGIIETQKSSLLRLPELLLVVPAIKAAYSLLVPATKTAYLLPVPATKAAYLLPIPATKAAARPAFAALAPAEGAVAFVAMAIETRRSALAEGRDVRLYLVEPVGVIRTATTTVAAV